MILDCADCAGEQVLHKNALTAAHNVVLEATMILDCAGQQIFQLFLFNHALCKGTLISSLRALTGKLDLNVGKRAHACIRHSEFASDIDVGTALVSMYGRCGSSEQASKVLLEMPERNAVSWNAMIAIYVRHGQHMRAHQLFQDMMMESITATKVTFVSILSICSDQFFLQEGKRFHSRIIAGGFELDIIVGNALLSMYCRCGDWEAAQRMFANMHHRNVVSWSVLLSSCVQHGYLKEALCIFCQMQEVGVSPNEFTFVPLLSLCADHADEEEGKKLHTLLIFYGFDSNTIIINLLIQMYNSCGSQDSAWKIFDDLIDRDVFSWTSIITAFAQHRQDKAALCLFHQMQVEGILPDKIVLMSILDACTRLNSVIAAKQTHICIIALGCETDVSVGSALIHMYSKCGRVGDASKIFDRMNHRNLVTWNTMIAMHAKQGQEDKAFEMFGEMQNESLLPDIITHVAVLEGCAGQANLLRGKWMHNYIIEAGLESEMIIESAMINMYGKCGSWEDAESAFSTSYVHDVATWNAMIGAFALHGQGKKCIELFNQMHLHGVASDQVTFMNILSACSYCGLLIEGWCVLVSMRQAYGVQPTVEHYNCMIDLLGRAGRPDYGEGFIKSMPCEPNATSWTALLGACKMHSNAAEVNCAAKHVCDLEPDIASTYILLLNILATTGE